MTFYWFTTLIRSSRPCRYHLFRHYIFFTKLNRFFTSFRSKKYNTVHDFHITGRDGYRILESPDAVGTSERDSWQTNNIVNRFDFLATFYCTACPLRAIFTNTSVTFENIKNASAFYQIEFANYFREALKEYVCLEISWSDEYKCLFLVTNNNYSVIYSMKIKGIRVSGGSKNKDNEVIMQHASTDKMFCHKREF